MARFAIASSYIRANALIVNGRMKKIKEELRHCGRKIPFDQIGPDQRRIALGGRVGLSLARGLGRCGRSTNSESRNVTPGVCAANACNAAFQQHQIIAAAFEMTLCRCRRNIPSTFTCAPLLPKRGQKGRNLSAGRIRTISVVDHRRCQAPHLQSFNPRIIWHRPLTDNPVQPPAGSNVLNVEPHGRQKRAVIAELRAGTALLDHITDQSLSPSPSGSPDRFDPFHATRNRRSPEYRRRPLGRAVGTGRQGQPPTSAQPLAPAREEYRFDHRPTIDPHPARGKAYHRPKEIGREVSPRCPILSLVCLLRRYPRVFLTLGEGRADG